MPNAAQFAVGIKTEYPATSVPMPQPSVARNRFPARASFQLQVRGMAPTRTTRAPDVQVQGQASVHGL